MHDAQEEEGAAGQEHAVRAGVIFVRLHALTILIPLNARGGAALRLAVEGGGLPLGDDQIRGVFHNPRCAVFKPCPGPCEVETQAEKTCNLSDGTKRKCLLFEKVFVCLDKSECSEATHRGG